MSANSGGPRKAALRRKRQAAAMDAGESDPRLTRAHALLADGHYGSAIAALEGISGAEATLLSAQAYIRLRRLPDALKALRLVGNEDRAHRSRADILTTSIEDRVRVAQSRAAADVPLPTFPQGVNPRTQAESSYYQALSLWIRGRGIEAIPLLRSLAKDENPNLRAWALELEAWIEKSRGRLPKAAKLFREVLDAFGQSDTRDELTRVSALLGLCFISVETTNATYFKRIVNEARTLVETGTTARLRVEVSYYVSIIHALEGNEASAFDVLLRARSMSPPAPFSALPELELAAFHRRHGEAYAAKIHLEFARAILERTSWGETDVEGLLLLAHYVIEAVAQREKSAAGAAMKLLSIDGRRDPMLAMHGDPVAVATALFARGAYYASVNKNDDAVADIRQARTIWLEHGYIYRAALASIGLFRLGEQSELTFAAAIAKAFPKSGIARDVRAARAEALSPVNTLTEAERRVLNGICAGLTSKQIAARLKRSPSTVRVQTASIFKKLGVNTRSAAIVAMANSRTTLD